MAQKLDYKKLSAKFTKELKKFDKVSLLKWMAIDELRENPIQSITPLKLLAENQAYSYSHDLDIYLPAA